MLAHPERYNFYHNVTPKYSDLKRVGALFQLNLLSLTQYYGKSVQKIALNLLEQDMYNFVGTDAHSIKHLESMTFKLNVKHISSLERLLKNY